MDGSAWMADEPEEPEEPEDVRAARQAGFVRLLMRRNQQDSVDVVVELRSRGLSPVLLKGVATRELLYPSEVRRSGDVDLLVAPSEHRACRRALADLGFSMGRNDGHASSWGAAGQTPVDLHRTLPRCGASARRVWRALAEHRTTITVLGSELTVLDGPAMAVHLAIHLTQTTEDRQLEDMRRAVAVLSPEEWSGAAAIARRIGASASLSWALDQVAGGTEVRRSLGLAAVSREQLPVTKPSEAGLVTFLTSPVHWRQRTVALANATRRVTSRESLTTWARTHGRPQPTTTAGSIATLVARAWHHLHPGAKAR
ncbi:MAG: nucleotidyltransferase family protein [Actinobacteria bacterium]|nr:nucleotidyltransferase family protein [Actinomycetota bacterium]